MKRNARIWHPNHGIISELARGISPGDSNRNVSVSVFELSEAQRDGQSAPVRTSTRFDATWSVVALSLAGLLLLFRSTAASALHLWETSSAYNYGYLIAPIAAYLIWEERRSLRAVMRRPSVLGLLLTAAFSAVWLLADKLDIDEGRHFALVGMVQGLFLSVLGTAVYRKLSFPLNYLWLMVPTGAFLLAPLQWIAHAGAVLLLQASGIPVFADGLIIEVPQGRFMVETGCAGLNFLLSAFALSLVYGKLIYRRLSTRILCVAIALVAAIVANILRIYLIISLTEWTDQKIGLADDHLLFGWGFFAIVMLGLMWAGAKVREANPAATPRTPDAVRPLAVNVTWSAAIAGLALCAAATGPLAAAVIERI